MYLANTHKLFHVITNRRCYDFDVSEKVYSYRDNFNAHRRVRNGKERERSTDRFQERQRDVGKMMAKEDLSTCLA